VVVDELHQRLQTGKRGRLVGVVRLRPRHPLPQAGADPNGIAPEMDRSVRAITDSDDGWYQFDESEWVLLASRLRTAEDLRRIANRIIDRLDTVASVNWAAGLAIGARSDHSAEGLLRDAEESLKESCIAGGGVVLFGAQHEQQRAASRQLVSELSDAIHSGAIEAYLQPIVDIEQNVPVSLEALVRWQHPIRGLQLPNVIVPLAAEAALAPELTGQVLGVSVEAVSAWLAEDSTRSLAVNVDRLALEWPGLAPAFGLARSDAGLERHQLAVEVSQDLAFSHPETVAERCGRLEMARVAITLDGVDTMPPRWQWELPGLNTIKVGVLMADTDELAPIVDRAKEHDLIVVATGVEYEVQAEAAKSSGVDRIQGFYVGRPEAPDNHEFLRPGYASTAEVTA